MQSLTKVGEKNGPATHPISTSVCRYLSITDAWRDVDCRFLDADFKEVMDGSKPTWKPSLRTFNT